MFTVLPFLVFFTSGGFFLVCPDEELPLAHVLDDCGGQRLEWTLGVRLEPLELELHDFVALAGLHRHLETLDIDDVAVVVLNPWRLALGIVIAHVCELGLGGHFHGTDFLALGGLECHRVE